MIEREFVHIAFDNLRRMKLRAALTILGVMIGVGALVSMLSFGFGVQRNVSEQFQRIGLLRIIQVVPGSPERDTTLTEPIPLDETALDKIAALDGVVMVYPQETFDARIDWEGHSEEGVVQALPASFVERRYLGEIVAGRFFASDTVQEAVVSRQWLKDRGLEPDSVLGRTVEIKVAGSGELVLGLAARFAVRLGLPKQIVATAKDLAQTFLGLLPPNLREVEAVGVAEIDRGFGFRIGDLLVPTPLMQGIDHLSFGDPLELMTMLAEPTAAGWPMLVVTLEHERDYDRVLARIEEMGYGTISFLSRFAEIRKSFLLFDMFVGAIGFIALFVAALGIVNTMVMSILERTREIGILKSLGAEDGQIRLLFLIESGTIGLAGSLGGIALGWLVSRAASFVMQRWMETQDVPVVDMFSLPVWVAAAAIAFGVLVSVMAGLYPASRASRIDPVQALRHD